MRPRKFAMPLVCLLSLPILNALAQDEPKFGAIEIASEPGAARVYIEGFLAGETPVKVDQVVPGPYRLVIKGDSYDDFVRDVPVAPGEVSKVEASLKSATGAWRSPVRKEDDWTPILDNDMNQTSGLEAPVVVAASSMASCISSRA